MTRLGSPIKTAATKKDQRQSRPLNIPDQHIDAQGDTQGQLPLAGTPLPGSVMPLAQQENMVPRRNAVAAANDREKPRPHYTDKADHDQTIPI